MKKEIAFYNLKLEIPYKNGFFARSYNELLYIEYKDLYCLLTFSDQKEFKVESSLEQMTSNLPNDTFFQCNRKTIINIHCCKEYNWETSKIEMEDGRKIDISRRRVKQFRKTRKNLRINLLSQPTI